MTTPTNRPPGVREEAAEGFAVAAADYAQARPDYPQDVVPWLNNTIGLSTGSSALDLGAGTGKFTQFVARTGARVIAVEPVETMRDELVRFLPGIDARPGSATDIPLTDESADAVLCAQCFHWFATRDALAEISRVLKPGGALGLIWNYRDQSVPWAVELEEMLKVYEHEETPQYHKGWWRDLFPSDELGPLQEHEARYIHRGPPETVIIQRSFSISYISLLPDDEKVRLRQNIEGLIERTPELSGQDIVDFPYRTLMVHTRKVST